MDALRSALPVAASRTTTAVFFFLLLSSAVVAVPEATAPPEGLVIYDGYADFQEFTQKHGCPNVWTWQSRGEEGQEPLSCYNYGCNGDEWLHKRRWEEGVWGAGEAFVPALWTPETKDSQRGPLSGSSEKDDNDELPLAGLNLTLHHSCEFGMSSHLTRFFSQRGTHAQKGRPNHKGVLYNFNYSLYLFLLRNQYVAGLDDFFSTLHDSLTRAHRAHPGLDIWVIDDLTIKNSELDDVFNRHYLYLRRVAFEGLIAHTSDPELNFRAGMDYPTMKPKYRQVVVPYITPLHDLTAEDLDTIFYNPRRVHGSIFFAGGIPHNIDWRDPYSVRYWDVRRAVLDGSDSTERGHEEGDVAADDASADEADDAKFASSTCAGDDGNDEREEVEILDGVPLPLYKNGASGKDNNGISKHPGLGLGYEGGRTHLSPPSTGSLPPIHLAELDHFNGFVALRNGRVLPDYYMARMMSDYCLEPPGDTPTRRSLYESALLGCIPVFFHNDTYRTVAFASNDQSDYHDHHNDNTHDHADSDDGGKNGYASEPDKRGGSDVVVIPWRKFTIYVDPFKEDFEGMMGLRAALSQISPDAIHNMRAEMRKWVHLLQWGSNGSGAFEFILNYDGGYRGRPPSPDPLVA